MLQDMWNLLITRWDFFGGLLAEHIEISLAAIAIAIVVGGLAGILISIYQRAAKPTLAVINFLYTIPSISMLGFLIPFSGVGDTTAIIALTIYALLPMVRAVHTGMANVDPAIMEAAKGMGGTRMQTLVRIQLPLALPVIMSGIRNMVTMTIALGGIASYIGAGGLGVAIYRGITTNNTAMTIVGSLLIAVLALVVDAILGFVEKRMQMRGQKAKRTNRRLAVGAAAVCAAAALGATLPGMLAGPSDTINVATKPMTEQYIMGEALKMLIEHDTSLEVNLTEGVAGGTSNLEAGMASGQFDLYPEYTGTGWAAVLENKGNYSEDEFGQLQTDYNEKLDMSWVGMYGFGNTFGIAVRSDVAQKYSLQTYSDLAKVANQLNLGAEPDFFEREDGYDALCSTYGMSFGKTTEMDAGLKYDALDQGNVDAIIVYTTDGKLSGADAKVLTDDKGFFPSYQCGNVVRNQALQQHPELRAELEKLQGTISEEDMARMNYEVEEDGKDPWAVAEEFLSSKGLI
ncbi:MAG: ABC transporter permease subunit [Atopobiaceae bacterium]|jgi:osmoprotectant transport system permease protein|nr:ABC transporter permease subunit [Atopobiaceae bacterium]MCI2051440.1 ABC transporter permease subunit [Atopobiaceae bacterium]